MDFRYKALRKMRDPDDIDSLARLANPTSWIATFVCLVLIVAAGIWSFVGEIPQTIGATGVLTRTAGVIRIQTQAGGIVEHVDVAQGQQVAANNPLMTVVGADGTLHAITTPDAATVIAIYVSAGSFLNAGTTALTLERAGDSSGGLSAALVVPTYAARLLNNGQRVDLAVADAPARSFGLLRGRISSVSAFQTDATELQPLVVGDQIIAQLLAGQTKRLVMVELTADAATVSRYAWTTAKGPPYPMQFQSGVTGSISRGSVSPINYLFGQ